LPPPEKNWQGPGVPDPVKRMEQKKKYFEKKKVTGYFDSSFCFCFSKTGIDNLSIFKVVLASTI
jgi:hypothetical protein